MGSSSSCGHCRAKRGEKAPEIGVRSLVPDKLDQTKLMVHWAPKYRPRVIFHNSATITATDVKVQHYKQTLNSIVFGIQEILRAPAGPFHSPGYSAEADLPERVRSIAGHDPCGDGFRLTPLPVVRRRIVTAVNGSALNVDLATAVALAGRVETVSAAVKRLPGANLDL